MNGGFQVIKFIMIDFSGPWQRSILTDAIFEYQPAPGPIASVRVVREHGTGVLMTYEYRVNLGETVYVSDQVVHLPGHCIGKKDGDTIRCGEQNG